MTTKKRRFIWVCMDDLAWFNKTITGTDKATVFGLLDARMRESPSGMSDLFISLMTGKNWSDDERQAASYFYIRGSQLKLWEAEPDLVEIASRYLNLENCKLPTEDTPNAERDEKDDDAEYLE